MKRREFITLLGGAAVAWPLAARAQQPALPTVGYLSGNAPERSSNLVAAFAKGLSEAGFVEGRNVALEYRWARFEADLLPGLATGLLVNQNSSQGQQIRDVQQAARELGLRLAVLNGGSDEEIDAAFFAEMCRRFTPKS